MKHTTPDSIKFKKLQRRLGCSKATLVGTLELLWIATQKNAPRGDIGKFDNETIAIECDWLGCPDTLVEALVECGWLDASDEFRLVVHDWAQHAPRYVHGVVSKLGGFVSAGLQSATIVRDYSTPLSPTIVDDSRARVLPNLTKPNLTQPNTLSASGRFAYPEEFEEFWLTYPTRRRTKKGEAFKAWKQATKQVGAKYLVQRAHDYAASELGQSEFACMPSVWLHSAMWEDAPEAWRRGADGQPSKTNGKIDWVKHIWGDENEQS